MKEFSLEGRPFVTLNNLLKLEGMSDSGGAAKHSIAEGLVLVDGQVETRKRCKIVAGQVVEFHGVSVRVTE